MTTDKQSPYVFLHMHRAGGSAIIRAALEAGLKFPLHHQHGHLGYNDGLPVYFTGKDAAQVHADLAPAITEEAEFFSLEWDFPRFEFFPQSVHWRFFTVLRNPLLRAMSNYRMDKINGWIPRELSFSEFMDGAALYRASNYYTKKLCSLWPLDEISNDHYEYAESVLRRFSAVFIIEDADLHRKVSEFGIPFTSTPINNFSDMDKRYFFTADEITPTLKEKLEFVKNNAFDICLYTRFCDLTFKV